MPPSEESQPFREFANSSDSDQVRRGFTVRPFDDSKDLNETVALDVPPEAKFLSFEVVARRIRDEDFKAIKFQTSFRSIRTDGPVPPWSELETFATFYNRSDGYRFILRAKSKPIPLSYVGIVAGQYAEVGWVFSKREPNDTDLLEVHRLQWEWHP